MGSEVVLDSVYFIPIVFYSAVSYITTKYITCQVKTKFVVQHKFRDELVRIHQSSNRLGGLLSVTECG